MPKTKDLLDGITALEITFVLVIESLAQRDPALVRRFVRSIDSILRNQRLSDGVRENLEALRAAFESNLPHDGGRG